MTGVNYIKCSCGGDVTEVPTNRTEEMEHGCGRQGCCVEAYKCGKCGVRWTIRLNAPDMETGGRD